MFQKLRTERGITQEQLGRDIGLTASAISNIECGRSVPSVDTLCRFSELFGVKVDSIISDSSESDLSRLEMEEKLVTVDRYLSEINEMSANYSIGHRNYEISKKGGEIVYKASSKD
ncbi:MAG: helix-turn-helix domain-containing protein [Lachnospira eligens]